MQNCYFSSKIRFSYNFISYFNTLKTREVVKLLIYDFFFCKAPTYIKKCFLCNGLQKKRRKVLLVNSHTLL